MNQVGRPIQNATGPAWIRTVLALSGVVWLVAFYLLCRPYRGVRHDAQLYFAQTQFHLTPDWLSHDLFFQYGSQDQYSMFSRVFAPVLRHWGLEHAEIGALLVLHTVFWIASYLLVRRIEPISRWGMLAALAVLPHFYGAFMTFSFAEPFLTARTLAEPLCLLGLAALAAGRPAWAFVALVLALAAHPLIAIPAWTVAWIILGGNDRRWIWAGVAVVAAVCITGAAEVTPFDGLYKSYDPAWSKEVHDANAFNFFAAWNRESAAVAIFDFALLWMGSRDRGSPLRLLYRAALIAGLGLCALGALLADGLNLILPTQLALWRSLWIVHYFALLALLPCARMLWRKNECGRLAAAMLMATEVIAAPQASTGWVFVAASLLVCVLALRGGTLSRRLAKAGIFVCVTGVVVMGVIEALDDVMIYLAHVHTGELFGRLEGIPSAIPQLMMAVAWLALLWPAKSARRWLPVASLGLGAGAAALGASIWDQRDIWARYVESHYGKPNPFHVELPPDAQVYWPDNMLATWTLLQRPAYVSLASSAATVYVRAEVMEAHRRWDAVLPMTIQINDCIKLAQEGHANYSASDCKYTDAGIRDACRAKGGPDDVILMNPLQAPPSAVWNFQPPGRPPEPFYLYDCHRF